MVTEMKKCIQRLDEIALRKTTFTNIDLLNELIENEKMKKEKGYLERILVYEETKAISK